MEIKEHSTENITIEKLYTKAGVWETETGTKLPYSNTIIEFKIGDYPLIFAAKVDKATKDYVELAYEN